MTLADVPTTVLGSLKKLVDAGDLVLPLTPAALRSGGLGSLESHAEFLALFDDTTLPALLEAVMAERRVVDAPELVWSGQTSSATTARDTSIVLRDLFRRAQREVLVAGFAFSHGEDIFAPLFEAMRDKGLRCRFYVDVGQAVRVGASVDEVRAAFFEKAWPFGEPLPDVYVNTSGLEGDKYSSLHAKCVVVDDSRVLIGSANFTERGQERNLEVGALIHDDVFARSLLEHWALAEHSGMFSAL